MSYFVPCGSGCELGQCRTCRIKRTNALSPAQERTPAKFVKCKACGAFVHNSTDGKALHAGKHRDTELLAIQFREYHALKRLGLRRG